MKIDVNKIKQKTGLEMIDVAKKVGCSYQWLVNVKRPEKFPKTLKTMMKLSKLTGLTIDELIKK
tara:strand:- start:149 stop:340 length:192 start_codon:yes stop_codon:yes gene_type:complete